MSTIYLIRHGEITQSEPRRFIGQQDRSLTELGRQQIVRLADYLATRSIDRVLTSPLLRCVESADILCGRMKIDEAEIVPDLREIGLGTWEGLTVDQVRHNFPGDYDARGRDLAGFRPPGGENFADLLHRAWPVFKSVATETDERVAIVAHAGVNRVLLCHILGMELGNLFSLGQDYGCVNTVRHDASGFRVKKININFCPWQSPSSPRSRHQSPPRW
jgi:broad specificity phosphatase PhoE